MTHSPFEALEALEQAIERGPAADGPTRYGAAGKALRRVIARLTRSQAEHYREVHRALVAELRAAHQELAALRARPQLGAVLNHGSGQLVLSRYRPALDAVRRAESAPFDAVVCEVQSSSGPLWFPTYDRFIRHDIAQHGHWELEETTFLREHVRPGSTVMNIGANVGYTTLLLAELVGDEGVVIALEPEPLNFSMLWANIALRGASNVLPVHTAAGDITGSIELQQSPDNSGDHRTTHQPYAVGAVTVPVVAIDDLVGDMPVTLVAIDAQGFDHRIVGGMQRLIEREHPVLTVEFWPPGILEAGDDPVQVIDRYRKLGYDSMSCVTTGDDIVALSSEAIVKLALDGRDHVTLAFR